ncbi:arsinothricin resistance N-acetyltransferase ArsN1 family B [Mycobacterium conspicuum]|jgi:phosphinothricin acetyltransferase|uniref:N-acetyltransferase n=1 Tax=Mycobacterium conspicuum TaxID=44010 RepID=A0A1X1T4A0_9MYCO|nr:arsinothricin resistance N-acetyltransferase ArsN1 family B [Mycobacterium conspicuum]ORV39393.1 GCN5 family acetyltransferase [Mycobacterium conspicuum]BBZ38048.1 N-acetyltransferase [Mycobacterium conspicuum]
MPPLVRPATEADAAACAEIYRPYVLDTVITFETEPPTVAEMAARIAAAEVMYEWLVCEVDGKVAGYAYAHQFNPRAAYQWSAETSIYMARDCVRRGGGRTLYAELLSRLTKRGFRRAFAGIAQPNQASIAFHESFGFRPVGHYQRVGWKLGGWHDVQWWQLDLVAPDDEVDPPTEIAT